MPVYNCEDFIAEAIESILDQTYRNFEFIIIDDCSTDGTCGIINGYKDPRINLIKKDKNTGLIDSLNLGINLSRGEFIARMDGDDISHVTRFAKQVNFLRSNLDIELCGTWFQMLPSNEVIKYPEDHENIKIALLDYCALAHPTVMFRKDFIAEKKLTYDPAFKSAEDYDLWTRMAAIGKLANLPEPLLTYRQHANQISAKDQYNQVKNSNLCRVRMMCYPLNNINKMDLENSKLLMQHDQVTDIGGLKEIVAWMDKICSSNKVTGFYNASDFKKYIDRKKAELIRRFYLHQTSYNPKVLYQFIKLRRHFSGYFNAAEQLKFSMKCMVFWK